VILFGALDKGLIGFARSLSQAIHRDQHFLGETLGSQIIQAQVCVFDGVVQNRNNLFHFFVDPTHDAQWVKDIRLPGPILLTRVRLYRNLDGFFK
jgi:hypothetical protein